VQAVRQDGRGRIGVIQGDDMFDGQAVRQVESGAPANRAYHGRSTPTRELRDQPADTTKQPLDEVVMPATGPSANTAPWSVIPGMPRQAPTSSLTLSGNSTACWAGTTVNCAAVPNGRYDWAPYTHTR
jgi:hypothetical protein